MSAEATAAAPAASAAPAAAAPTVTTQPPGGPAAASSSPTASSGVPPMLSKTSSMLVTGARIEYPKLIILKATYGLTKNSDVLTAIRKQQQNQGGGLSFPQKAEFNWSLGDPEPGANKSLKLWWKYGDDGDEQFEAWFENGGRKAVLLPKDDRPSEKYVGPLHFTALHATDVAGFGSKLKSLYVRIECAGQSAQTKPTDGHAKQPEWGKPPLKLTFDGNADAKTNVTITLCEKNFLFDSVVGRATCALAVLSGDRTEGRVLELFDDKSGKTVTAKLHFTCVYSGRGGPRAPRGKGLALDTNSSYAGSAAAEDLR